jgi:hypothetical protein
MLSTAQTADLAKLISFIDGYVKFKNQEDFNTFAQLVVKDPEKVNEFMRQNNFENYKMYADKKYAILAELGKGDGVEYIKYISDNEDVFEDKGDGIVEARCAGKETYCANKDKIFIVADKYIYNDDKMVLKSKQKNALISCVNYNIISENVEKYDVVYLDCKKIRGTATLPTLWDYTAVCPNYGGVQHARVVGNFRWKIIDDGVGLNAAGQTVKWWNAQMLAEIDNYRRKRTLGVWNGWTYVSDESISYTMTVAPYGTGGAYISGSNTSTFNPAHSNQGHINNIMSNLDGYYVNPNAPVAASNPNFAGFSFTGSGESRFDQTYNCNLTTVVNSLDQTINQGHKKIIYPNF